MKRLTVYVRGKYVIEDDSRIHHQTDGYYGGAVDLIARLEDYFELTQARLTEVNRLLDELKTQGRERSLQFRELAGQRSVLTFLLDEIETNILNP